MKSTYIYRGNHEEIEISFNLDNSETNENIRDELGLSFLSELLNSGEEVKDRFYLDEVEPNTDFSYKELEEEK